MLRYLPVSPLYYGKPYTKAVGVGLSPYPYAEGVTSLLQKKRYFTAALALRFHVATATFHIPLSGIFHF